MDIPVLGRFFGRTVDEFDRTELIMLITPHVIRNREESRKVTEDFKKSLSTIRNELERMSREREKLQQRPLEEKPALPGPSGDAPPIPPSPAPTQGSAPAGSKLVAPMRKISSQSNMSPPFVPAGNVVELGNAKNRGGAVSRPAPNPQPAQAPQIDVQPAYALSFGAVHPSPIPAPTEGPPAKLSAGALSRRWAVQVAALADKKDADEMVLGLRSGGYDAYVITSQVESKTWHRVRVGQFADIGLAKQLKQTLTNFPRFKGAYIAAN
jgi:cell division septation protein DedD